MERQRCHVVTQFAGTADVLVVDSPRVERVTRETELSASRGDAL